MRCHVCCFALVLVLTTLKGTNGSTTQRTTEVTPAVNSSSTKSPGTESPGQDCSNGIYQCWQYWYIEFENATSEDGSCRAINKLADCYLGLDQCDPNYIRFELIPGTYSLAQQQGLPCVAPTFTSQGITVRQLPDFTTKTPQPTGGTYRTTTQQTTEVTPGADCLDGLKVCRKDLDAADINSLSTEQFCGLLGQASACYLQLSQCDRNWVQYVLIPGEYEEARKQQNFCQLPDFKTTTPQPTSVVNSSSTKSPGTESPGPDCSTGIQLCLNDYTADAMAVTSLTDFCRIAKNLADCFLDLDQCDQNYIRFELIPGTYSVIQQQGLPCVAPTFSPPGTTVSPTPPVWSTSPTSQLPDFKTTTPQPTSAVNSSSTKSPGTESPGPDCSTGIQLCLNDYTADAKAVTSLTDFCRITKNLADCYLDLDQCDQNYIRFELIPVTYNVIQQRGLPCVAPTFSPPGTTVSPPRTSTTKLSTAKSTATPPVWSTSPTSQLPDFKTTTPQPTSAVNSSSTKSPGTESPGPDCNTGIQLCLNDYTADAMAVTSLTDFCRIAKNLADCYLDLDQCDQNYIRFELIPGTYSVIQQQGLPCVAPTFAPPGTTVNPPRTSTTKLSTAKSTVTSPVWSTSSTSRSYTGTSQRPSTGLPGQDCEAALESCVRKYAELGSTATSTENMCRYIEILCHCFLKQDACDKNYILYTVIPYSYASAQQQGITCKQPDFTHTTTTTVTRTTTRLPTTVQPALQFCDNEIRQCQTDFEKKVPYSSYSEYCQLIYSYRDCMWNIGVCDYGYLRRTIEDYVDANIRDCDRDTSAQSGQTPLRPLDWPGVLTLLTLSCLMQLLSPWLFI